MRPIHRIVLRQNDSPPFWGKEWFIRGCNEAAALRMVLSAIAFLALGAANAEAKSVGAYTGVQASRGAAVYTQRCAVRLGANLQGERLVAVWPHL
jgi:hypothetical protein